MPRKKTPKVDDLTPSKHVSSCSEKVPKIKIAAIKKSKLATKSPRKQNMQQTNSETSTTRVRKSGANSTNVVKGRHSLPQTLPSPFIGMVARNTRSHAQKNEQSRLSFPLHEFSLYDQYREPVSDSEENDPSEAQLLEQLTILKSLNRRETELKIAILFEKLKNDEECVLQKVDVLVKDIDELENALKEIKNDLSLKEIMCYKSQLIEILLRIVHPHQRKVKNKTKDVFEYSDEERKLIKDLLIKKREMNREIALEQQQIAELEEECRMMKKSIDQSMLDPTNSSPAANTSNFNPNVTMKEMEALSGSVIEKELAELATENTQRNSRVQLLSKIILSLIQSLEPDHNLKDDIKLISASCEKILTWNYDDLDEMEEICKSVSSTQI